MKHRIWELDAFRGLSILFMIFLHLMYDLVELYQIIDWEYPLWFRVLNKLGGIVFLVLSGLCVTLGRHCLRRGLTVLGCGMLVSAVTCGMYLFGFDKSILIYFGVLHCLGTCMILWLLFRHFPSWLLLVLGVIFIVAGLYLWDLATVDYLWLMPLGLKSADFVSSDYFPLLPNLGYFLIGAVIGRLAYRKKVTLLPAVNPKNPAIRALTFCGRHSLIIYLLHQPILSGICMLL